MGIRTSIENYEDLLAAGRLAFIDGIIQGEPLAKTVSGIIGMASAFGGDEAERSDHFFARVDYTTSDDLKRASVEATVEALFSGKTPSNTVGILCRMGAAFGFQITKRMDKFGALDKVMYEAKRQYTKGEVSPKTVDAFFGEVMKIMEASETTTRDKEIVIEKARIFLTETQQKFDNKLPNFHAFFEYYSAVIA